MIEDAYRTGEAMGLAVWCTDQAGPFQAVPQPGQSWRPEGRPARRPHEYVRNGTAKVLTLFHPADGRVRVAGVTACLNPVLHAWLKRELTVVLAELPASPTPAIAATADPPTGAAWRRWRDGLSNVTPPSADLPPLRMLLVLDDLAGHKTPDLVCWLFAHGIMPLYTPLGGSWLSMAESLQRILERGRWRARSRARRPDHRMVRGSGRALESVPTPFVWGGERAARRRRQRERRHRLGGSGACAGKPIKRPGTSYGHAQRE